MADVKISELTALTSPSGGEELVVNASGTTKKITQANLLKGINNTAADATAITIDASENVGIGTSSPTAILDVRRGDASGKIAEFHTSTGYGVEIGSSQAEAYIKAGSSQALKIGTNSTERLRIDSSGTVGIGTSSAGSWTKLEVAGTGGAQTGATQALHVSSPSATANEGVGIRLNAGSGSHEAIGVIGMVNNASGNFGSMTFHTYSGGSYITERMRIDSGGHAIISGGVTLGNGLTYAAANTLDDYEEGTFNPYIQATGTNCTGLSFADGYYTKIGRLVNLSFKLEATITSASAETSILFALPLTTINSFNQAAGGTANFYAGSGANRFGIGAIYNGTSSNTTSHIYIPAYAMNTSGAIGEARVSMTYLTP